jgi:hypothetical protein
MFQFGAIPYGRIKFNNALKINGDMCFVQYGNEHNNRKEWTWIAVASYALTA